jgi:hypothetical protein
VQCPQRHEYWSGVKPAQKSAQLIPLGMLWSFAQFAA